MTDPHHLQEQLEKICEALGACAAGYWRLDSASEQLIQMLFLPGSGLGVEVGRQFADATRSVALSQEGLGIVAAARLGAPAVSRVDELPTDSGSGRWLRAFGAARSVALPIGAPGGPVQGVLSVALPRSCQLSDSEVAEILQQSGIG